MRKIPGLVWSLQIARSSGIPVVRLNAKENEEPPRRSFGAFGRPKGRQGSYSKADGRREKYIGPQGCSREVG
jgi:hypothetical protein